MGTQQELTTEQISLLLMIKAIEDFGKENPGNIPPGGVKEVLTCDGVIKPEDYDRVTETLEYYGYLSDEEELTADGRQYIELFAEYMQEKVQNPQAVHNSYSLINVEKLSFNIEACLMRCGIAEKLVDVAQVVQAAKKGIKGLLSN